ncbi:MAG: zf-HC2 domain-containing protein [Candidatus Aminicenantes bacterium]|jgi:hypothetical protein
MRKCKHEDLIDDYLLDKLTEEKKQQFEAHYFNCRVCFEKMAERDELLTAIKYKGHTIFQDLETETQVDRVPLLEQVWAFLTPKQWVLATVTAALILVVVLNVLPILRTTSPQFFINDDLVRGGSIKLISPVIAVNAIPSQFRWESLGEDVEYKIEIYNHELLWSATTSDHYIALPPEVKERMVAGEKYAWQVKAFSTEGTLIAVSSKVQFPVTK